MEERRAKLRAEREAKGLELEEIDQEAGDEYLLEIEEKDVPDGQKPNKEVVAKDAEYADFQIKKVVWNQPKLQKLKAGAKLPPKCPDNLVYWNKCETRIQSQRLMPHKKLLEFQKTQIIQYEDATIRKKVFGDKYPFIQGLECFMNPNENMFENKHESGVYLCQKWPEGFKTYETEGLIKFEMLKATDCLFNSRFESGNLRQVFKVPVETDYEWVEIAPEVPDYLPEELQEEERKKFAEILKKRADERREKHEEEEKQEEESMKALNAVENVLGQPIAGADFGNAQQSQPGADLQNVPNPGDPAKPKRLPGQVDVEYNCYLQDDTNADSALYQWYYFSVMNIRRDTLVKINICNLTKPNNLYDKGMKPYVYSVNKNKTEGKGWHRGGEKVTYKENNVTIRYQKIQLDAPWLDDGTKAKGSENFKTQHTLSFEYKFTSDYDIVFFAHFVPYTYTDYLNYMGMLHANQDIKNKCRLDYICDTLGKNPVYGLTITNNIQTEYVLQDKEIIKFRNFEYRKHKVKPKKIKFVEVADDSSSHKSAKVEEVEKKEEVKEEDKPVQTIPPEPNSPESPDLPAPNSPASPSKPPQSQLGSPTKKATDLVLSMDGKDVESVVSELRSYASPSRYDSAYLLPSMKESHLRLGDITEGIEIPALPSGADVDQGANVDPNKANPTKDFAKRLEPISGKPGAAPRIREQKDNEEKRYRKHIFITSRVHPGESQASFLVQGVIEFLLSEDTEAQELREKFVIKIVPMLNPDGVLHGNYRVSLLGVDLNRRWQKPSRFLHPTIYWTKQLVKYFNEKSRTPELQSGGVVMCCDIHGHSRNMDLFMYCCNDDYSPLQSQFAKNLCIKACPYGVDKMCPLFNIRECKFSIDKDKENTARVVLFKELGIVASFTLECTFYGSEYLRRMKAGSTALMSKEQIQKLADRYGIDMKRPEISITENHCFLMGADFLRGINFSSKQRPLLQYWFRNPPPVLIELPKRDPLTSTEQEDIDPVLLELEKAWRPLGNVKQDKHLGIGDRYDKNGKPLPDLPPTPPEEKGPKKRGGKDMLDIAEIDKEKQRQKELRAKALQQAKEAKRQGLIDKELFPEDILDEIQSMHKGKKGRTKSSKDINQDMLGVISPGKKKRRKGRVKSPHAKKRSFKKIPVEKNADDEEEEVRTSVKKVEDDNLSNDIPLSNNSLKDESDKDSFMAEDEVNHSIAKGHAIPAKMLQALSEYTQPEDHVSMNATKRYKMSISSFEELKPEVPPKNKMINDPSTILLKDAELIRDSTEKFVDMPTPRPLNLPVIADRETPLGFNHRRKNRGSVKRIDVESSASGKNKLNVNLSLTNSAEKEIDQWVTMKQDDLSISGMQLNRDMSDDLDYYDRGGSRAQKRIESALDLKMDGKRAIQAQAQSATKTQRKAKELLKSNNLQPLEDISVLAQANDTESKLIQMLQSLDKQDWSTFQPEMQYEILQARQKLNKILQPPAQIYQRVVRKKVDTQLTTDPAVFPSEKLEQVSSVKMKTIRENYVSTNSNNNQFKTPRASPKGIWAPMNAVYSQCTLLKNPELASKSNIHFQVQSVSHDPYKNAAPQVTSAQVTLTNNKSKKNRVSGSSPQQSRNSLSPGHIEEISAFASSMAKLHDNQVRLARSPFPYLKKMIPDERQDFSSFKRSHTLQKDNSILAAINNCERRGDQLTLLEKSDLKIKSKEKLPGRDSFTELNNLLNHEQLQMNAAIMFPLQSQQVQQAYMAYQIEQIKQNYANKQVMKNDFTLPPLSPTYPPINQSTLSLKKQPVRLKDGFRSAINREEKEVEKLTDLRQFHQIRKLQKKQTHPAFVFKALDQREILSIQLAEMVSDPTSRPPVDSRQPQLVLNNHSHSHESDCTIIPKTVKMPQTERPTVSLDPFRTPDAKRDHKSKRQGSQNGLYGQNEKVFMAANERKVQAVENLVKRLGVSDSSVMVFSDVKKHRGSFFQA